jgi:hypothetical protein
MSPSSPRRSAMSARKAWAMLSEATSTVTPLASARITVMAVTSSPICSAPLVRISRACARTAPLTR